MRGSRFWLFIIITLVGVGLLLRQRSTTVRVTSIETARVERKTLIEEVTSSGKTKAQKQVHLHFQTGGRLAWVGVIEGDSVSAYQALARLDSQELKKNLDKALRDYAKERNDFEEDKQVTYKDKVTTDTIKRILEKNQWDLEKAVLDVELSDVVLKWSSLTTPIFGTVTHIDTPIAGINITPTDTFTVADPTTIVFNANIDETDIGKISISQAADINLDAYPDKTFPGKVTKIAFAAETTAGRATVYPVEITFTETPSLRLGLNGDVSIKIQEMPNVISIPSEAIRETGPERYVIKKTGETFAKVRVIIGTVTDIESQVLEGLVEGDEVVVRGFQLLPKVLQP